MSNQTVTIKQTQSSKTAIEASASYTIDGKQFLVERLFKKDSSNTLGTVLLKLMQTDSQPL